MNDLYTGDPLDVAGPSNENEHKHLTTELIIDDMKQESTVDENNIEEAEATLSKIPASNSINNFHSGQLDLQDGSTSMMNDLYTGDPLDVAGPSDENEHKHLTTELIIDDMKQESTVDENIIEEAEATPSKIPRYSGDLATEDFSTPIMRERNKLFIKNDVDDYREQIDSLTKENKKLEQSMSSMKDLLETLKNNETLSKEAAAAILVFTDGWNPIFYEQYVGKPVHL